MAPTFIGIGPPRTGSTSLWACLRLHPDIEMARIKEIDWFSSPNWDPTKTAHYENNWLTDKPARGEISTNYFRYVDRILSVYPDVKIIMTVRNPVDRFLSSIVLRYKRSTEVLPPREEFQQLVEAHLLNGEYHQITAEELAVGNYQQWINCVNPGQVLTVKSEDLFQNQQETLVDVFNFLGVRPFKYIPYQQENASTWRFDFSKEFLTALEGYYASK